MGIRNATILNGAHRGLLYPMLYIGPHAKTSSCSSLWVVMTIIISCPLGHRAGWWLGVVSPGCRYVIHRTIWQNGLLLPLDPFDANRKVSYRPGYRPASCGTYASQEVGKYTLHITLLGAPTKKTLGSSSRLRQSGLWQSLRGCGIAEARILAKDHG